MAYMRTSLAFTLFWVNFIVTSLNIFFSVMITSSSPSSPSSKSSSSSSSTYPYTPRASIPKYPYNPSSTYKPPYIPSSILPKTSTVPSSISSIFDKLKNTLSKLRKTEEIEIEKNINYFLDKEIETPKELRNLSIDGIEGALLFINIGTFLFIVILFILLSLTLILLLFYGKLFFNSETKFNIVLIFSSSFFILFSISFLFFNISSFSF